MTVGDSDSKIGGDSDSVSHHHLFSPSAGTRLAASNELNDSSTWVVR